MADGKLWCGNGIESIIVLANDPRKAREEMEIMAKKPKGHKKGCKCAVCSRMHHGTGHKAKPHGNAGAMAKYKKPRHPNAPAVAAKGLLPGKIGAWILIPGIKEGLTSGAVQILLPLVGKALVMVPVKQVQQGVGNIGAEWAIGTFAAAGVARLSPMAGRITAEYNMGRAYSRGANLLTGGKIGLAPLSENRGLHLSIDEAMAALLPSLNALLPSLNGDPESTGAGAGESGEDVGAGGEGGEDVGAGETIGVVQGGSI